MYIENWYLCENIIGHKSVTRWTGDFATTSDEAYMEKIRYKVNIKTGLLEEVTD